MIIISLAVFRPAYLVFLSGVLQVTIFSLLSTATDQRKVLAAQYACQVIAGLEPGSISQRLILTTPFSVEKEIKLSFLDLHVYLSRSC
jgi:hypothetical protein